MRVTSIISFITINNLILNIDKNSAFEKQEYLRVSKTNI